MGIEEYRFLTKTMEQIADCSSQLETAKNERLKKHEDRLHYLERDLEDANRKIKKQVQDIRKAEDKVAWNRKNSNPLKRLRKAELVALADEKGVARSGTKDDIIARLNVAEEAPSVAEVKRVKKEIESEVAIKNEFKSQRDSSFSTLLTIFYLASMSWFVAQLSTGYSVVGSTCCFQLFGPLVLVWVIFDFEPVIEAERELKILNSRLKEINRQTTHENKLKVAKTELGDLKKAADTTSGKISNIERKITQRKIELHDLKNRITSLEEEEIPALWDSIGHLIPYSSALEKA